VAQAALIDVMEILKSLWAGCPWGTKLGILLFPVLLVLAALDIFLKRKFPRIGHFKMGPDIPDLSTTGKLLFSCVLNGTIALGGTIIMLAFRAPAPANTASRVWGVGAVVCLFAAKSVWEFVQWRKIKKK
jgi:hypothetical protein